MRTFAILAILALPLMAPTCNGKPDGIQSCEQLYLQTLATCELQCGTLPSCGLTYWLCVDEDINDTIPPSTQSTCGTGYISELTGSEDVFDLCDNNDMNEANDCDEFGSIEYDTMCLTQGLVELRHIGATIVQLNDCYAVSVQ